MTDHQKPRLTSGLLPHQIAALGPQEMDDEKAFRMANGAYRAIRAIEEALSFRWLRAVRRVRDGARTATRVRSLG